METNLSRGTVGVSRYHPLLVALHWALAVLVIADLTIGALVLVHIPNDVPRKIEGLRAHMSGGIIILTLMLARLALRIGTASPAAAPAGSPLLDRLAWLSHRLLYIAVFGMAGSGLLLGLQAHLPDVVFFRHGALPRDFWAYPLRGVHYFFSRLLMALIALHIAGALYHTVVRRDHLLGRMAFGRRYSQDATDSYGVATVEHNQGKFWQSPWLSRLILVFPALLFFRIGARYVSDPLQVAAASGIVLGSPAAITDTRAIGAIFLAVAVLIVFSLLSVHRLLRGLILVATVVGFATAVRVAGIALDGAASETLFKLKPELLLLCTTVVGILLEVRRLRRLEQT